MTGQLLEGTHVWCAASVGQNGAHLSMGNCQGQSLFSQAHDGSQQYWHEAQSLHLLSLQLKLAKVLEKEEAAQVVDGLAWTALAVEGQVGLADQVADDLAWTTLAVEGQVGSADQVVDGLSCRWSSLSQSWRDHP